MKPCTCEHVIFTNTMDESKVIHCGESVNGLEYVRISNPSCPVHKEL